MLMFGSGPSDRTSSVSLLSSGFIKAGGIKRLNQLAALGFIQTVLNPPFRD